MRSRLWLILAATWGLVMLLALPVAAQDDATQIAITSPQEGETISGAVTILGSADHPNQFAAYQLWFALSGTEQWFPITTVPVESRVFEGELGQWNTTVLPPGEYRLRLRVFLMDGSFSEMLVDGLEIQPVQEQQAATETNSPATDVPPTAIPTLPDVTRAVEANAAPPPVAEPITQDAASTTSSAGDSSAPNLATAFCIGAALGVTLFGLIAAYSTLRTRARSGLRRFLAKLDETEEDSEP